MEKYTGIIKFYNPPKRYGFIKYLYRDKDIFFHISSVDSAPEKICKDIVVSFLTDTKNESSPDSCVKCYTMFLPFLLIKIDVFS